MCESKTLIDVSSLRKISTFAAAIGKTPAWVHKLISEGDLNAVRIDGAWFVLIDWKYKKFVKE